MRRPVTAPADTRWDEAIALRLQEEEDSIVGDMNGDGPVGGGSGVFSLATAPISYMTGLLTRRSSGTGNMMTMRGAALQNSAGIVGRGRSSTVDSDVIAAAIAQSERALTSVYSEDYRKWAKFHSSEVLECPADHA